MQAPSANGTEVPPTSPHPLPVPPRWHLRTQVSRKTLFDLIQDTLPAQGLRVAGSPGGVAIATASTAPGGEPQGPVSAPNGVVPQAYLDSLAATVPMALNPSALWSDGDTTPDIPEHWRPITITLTSSSPLPPPPSPLPPVPQPLHAIAKTAGWMLAGAALTFLVSAAAFGGKPMLRAIRTVMAPQVQRAMEPPELPGPLPAPARLPLPAPAGTGLPGTAVVALADRREGPVHTIDGASAGDRAPAVKQDVDTAGDSSKGGATARGAHRLRQDRRLAKSLALTDAGRADTSVPGGDDAVMPLASAETDARPGSPAATPTTAAAMSRASAIAKAPSAATATSGARGLRPLDLEDPFGDR